MFILMVPYPMASRISSKELPLPPWNTNSTGSGAVWKVSSMCFWQSFKMLGRNSTLPGLYTPCTLPNAAATVKLGEMALRTLYASATSSGCVYNRLLSMSVLSTPSSSPPVTPSSISRCMSMAAMRLRYAAQVSKLSSRLSSLRSIMCELNNGLPVLA